jgi:hypothetical protein
VPNIQQQPTPGLGSVQPGGGHAGGIANVKKEKDEVRRRRHSETTLGDLHGKRDGQCQKALASMKQVEQFIKDRAPLGDPKFAEFHARPGSLTDKGAKITVEEADAYYAMANELSLRRALDNSKPPLSVDGLHKQASTPAPLNPRVAVDAFKATVRPKFGLGEVQDVLHDISDIARRDATAPGARIVPDANGRVADPNDAYSYRLGSNLAAGEDLSKSLLSEIDDFPKFQRDAADFVQQRSDYSSLLPAADMPHAADLVLRWMERNPMQTAAAAMASLSKAMVSSGPVAEEAKQLRNLMRGQLDQLLFATQLLGDENFLALVPDASRQKMRDLGKLFEKIARDVMNPQGPFMATCRLAEATAVSPGAVQAEWMRTFAIVPPAPVVLPPPLPGTSPAPIPLPPVVNLAGNQPGASPVVTPSPIVIQPPVLASPSSFTVSGAANSSPVVTPPPVLTSPSNFTVSAAANSSPVVTSSPVVALPSIGTPPPVSNSPVTLPIVNQSAGAPAAKRPLPSPPVLQSRSSTAGGFRTSGPPRKPQPPIPVKRDSAGNVVLPSPFTSTSASTPNTSVPANAPVVGAFDGTPTISPPLSGPPPLLPETGAGAPVQQTVPAPTDNPPLLPTAGATAPAQAGLPLPEVASSTAPSADVTYPEVLAPSDVPLPPTDDGSGQKYAPANTLAAPVPASQPVGPSGGTPTFSPPPSEPPPLLPETGAGAPVQQTVPAPPPKQMPLTPAAAAALAAATAKFTAAVNPRQINSEWSHVFHDVAASFNAKQPRAEAKPEDKLLNDLLNLESATARFRTSDQVKNNSDLQLINESDKLQRDLVAVLPQIVDEISGIVANGTAIPQDKKEKIRDRMADLLVDSMTLSLWPGEIGKIAKRINNDLNDPEGPFMAAYLLVGGTVDSPEEVSAKPVNATTPASGNDLRSTLASYGALLSPLKKTGDPVAAKGKAPLGFRGVANPFRKPKPKAVAAVPSQPGLPQDLQAAESSANEVSKATQGGSRAAWGRSVVNEFNGIKKTLVEELPQMFDKLSQAVEENDTALQKTRAEEIRSRMGDLLVRTTHAPNRLTDKSLLGLAPAAQKQAVQLREDLERLDKSLNEPDGPFLTALNLVQKLAPPEEAKPQSAQVTVPSAPTGDASPAPTDDSLLILNSPPAPTDDLGPPPTTGVPPTTTVQPAPIDNGPPPPSDMPPLVPNTSSPPLDEQQFDVPPPPDEPPPVSASPSNTEPKVELTTN